MDTILKHFCRIEFKKIPFKCATDIRRATAPKDLMDSLPQSQPWSWPTTMDAVVASPDNNRVLLENDDIRIVEVTVRPGQKENLGGHPWVSALLFDETQPNGVDISDDGKVVRVNRRLEAADFPVAVRVGPLPPHAFENTDSFAAHFYRVEFKKLKFNS